MLTIAEKECNLPKNSIMICCKNCSYRGFKDSLFCTFEDRFINTGQCFKRKKDKNIKGNCRDYKQLWWKFWLTDQHSSVKN